MTKLLIPILSGLALCAQVASLCAQTGAAPVVTMPAATTENVTGADPGKPQVPTGPAAARATADVARTRRLVRAVNENTGNIKAIGNFGAQLWLVSGRQFFEDWKKPQEQSIDPVDLVPRGETVYTALIFYGTAHDGGGLANVTYDIVVKRPNGSIYDRRDDAIGYQNLAPTDERQLLLGRDSLGITISETDPAGLYTVEVTVRDNVGRSNLALVQHFVVR